MKILLAAILAATVMTPQPSAIEEAYAAGEVLDYSLAWLRITGGSARMTIAPLDTDSQKLRITSVGKSSKGFSRVFKVRDEIETIIRRDDFSTVEYHKRLDEKGDKKNEQTLISDGVAVRTKSTSTKTFRIPVPDPVLDPISVIFYLRKLDLSVGSKYDLTLLADGKLYTVQVEVTRRETIKTEAGTFKTVVVEPKMESKGVQRDEKLTIWYSDDDLHIPVRIRTEVNFGAITASFRGRSTGPADAEPPAIPEK